MQVRFDLPGDVLRVEVRERETAQETRELAEMIFAEREKHGVLAIPMLAAQRGVPYRAFTSESEALAWLRSLPENDRGQPGR